MNECEKSLVDKRENLTSHQLAKLLLQEEDMGINLMACNHNCCESWQEKVMCVKYYVEDNKFIIEEGLGE